MFSHWTLNDSKSFQVSRTFLSIWADLDNVVVRMVSTSPLISKSSSPFTNPLRIVLIITGITVTLLLLILLFYSFESSSHHRLPIVFDYTQNDSQVSSTLQQQQSTLYSNRSQPCPLFWVILQSSFYFQVLQSLYKYFADCTECTNYNWYHRHLYSPSFFFHFSSKVLVFISLFASLSFSL